MNDSQVVQQLLQRFDQIDAQFNSINARFDSVDARLNEADRKTDRMAAAMVNGFAEIHRRLDQTATKEEVHRIYDLLDRATGTSLHYES